MQVKFANSVIDIARCFPIMVQLRPCLNQSEFVSTVQHQQEGGYHLVYLEENTIKAIAGFRILDILGHGRLFYVDDLITDASEYFKGYGRTLLNWLVDHAKSQGCTSLEFNSGTGITRHLHSCRWLFD